MRNPLLDFFVARALDWQNGKVQVDRITWKFWKFDQLATMRWRVDGCCNASNCQTQATRWLHIKWIWKYFLRFDRLFVYGFVHVHFFCIIPFLRNAWNPLSTVPLDAAPTVQPTSFPILSSHLTHKHCSYLIWNFFVLLQTTFASSQACNRRFCKKHCSQSKLAYAQIVIGFAYTCYTDQRALHQSQDCEILGVNL